MSSGSTDVLTAGALDGSSGLILAGSAGIDNQLYFSDRTWMLFGDAKNVVGELLKQFAAGSGMH